MRSSESDAGAERFDRALNADRVQLRRLSSVLYAFIRQSVREHRHGTNPGVRRREPTLRWWRRTSSVGPVWGRS